MKNRRLTEEEAQNFWADVVATLEDRAHDMAGGPRNVAQLAKRIGCSRPRLANSIRERATIRIYGDWPSVEVVAKGLSVEAVGWPMTVEALLE